MRLLKKFISFTSFTLKRFIFTATLIVSAVTFVTVIATVSSIFLWQSEEISTRKYLAMARQMLDSVSLAMEEGRNLSDMKKILESYQRSFPGRYTIAIHPGKTINRSASQLPEEITNLGKAFSKGVTIHRRTFNTLENILPVKAESKCLGCHTSAQIGEVLGVLTINEDIKDIVNTGNRESTKTAASHQMTPYSKFRRWNVVAFNL